MEPGFFLPDESHLNGSKGGNVYGCSLGKVMRRRQATPCASP